MQRVVVRPHMLDDAEAIGEVLADGWRQAYGGVLPEAVVAPRADRAARRAELREFLEEAFEPGSETVLVAEAAGIVIGFAHVTDGDKGDVGAGAAVNLLYVRADRQGQGIGRLLLAEAATWIGSRTPKPVVISAFAANPFRSFYARIGGRVVKERVAEIDGHQVPSILYLWDNAASLLAATADH